MVTDYTAKSRVREIEREDMITENMAADKSKNFTYCGENKTIPISSIQSNPHQPRLDMDETALKELARSIEEYGLMQPITVRRLAPFSYELIAGERRLTACKSLGMTYIPAIVMSASSTDSAILALVENIQRENLNYIEEAEAFANLLNEHNLTQEELAYKLGKSQSTIANKIRILKLSPQVREILAEHNLTERHARALLRLPDENRRLKALRIIVEKNLNVSKTETLIDRILQGSKKQKKEMKNLRVFKDVRIFTNTIRQAVDMMRKSGIEAKANKKETPDSIEYTIVIPKPEEEKN